MRIRHVIAGVLAALCAGAACMGQTTIELRPSARAPAGAAVRLIDIAQVTGEEAGRLGAAVVLDVDQASAAARSGRLEVEVATVRGALERVGVNWGRTILSGGVVAVRLVGEASSDGPAAATPARGGDGPAFQIVDLSGAATVRTHIAARLAHLFGVGTEDLRLRFRAEDEPLLGMRTAGRRVDVQPAASSSSSRLPLRVYVYAGDRVAATGGVTVEVQVRRDVATAAALIERGQVIGEGMTSLGSRWLEPNARTPASAEQLGAGGGAVARERINAGEVITLDMIQPPVAARRGDLVTVHCLSGSVTVRVRARAMVDIRDGEVGGFRMEGSKKTFRARMDGSGRAVMVVDGLGPLAGAQELGR